MSLLLVLAAALAFGMLVLVVILLVDKRRIAEAESVVHKAAAETLKLALIRMESSAELHRDSTQ